jgi:glucose/arabinose dehydrogenase
MLQHTARTLLLTVGLVAGSSAAAPMPPSDAGLPLDEIMLPRGFHIGVYAEVPGARAMALAPDGTLFVGTRGDKVYAVLPPASQAAKHGGPVITLLQSLNTPNGVAFHDGSLYVAEISRVLRYDGILARLRNPPPPVVVNDHFPHDAHHGWKFIRFGPDGMLYVPVGAPCNICEPDPARYAAIFRMRPDGSGLERYARGVRNTVGFDWDPDTRELWFTDNGRDWLGNDAPPDELDHAPHAGMNFGYPYCHGRSIADPEFGEKHACTEFTPPDLELDAHVAALGMRFYTGTMFPATYRKQIFIAEHGSWNRFPPIGYRVVLVRLKDGHAASREVFAQGWLRTLTAWGRPVDVQVAPDGALLVSDDRAGVIYRIGYGE